MSWGDFDPVAAALIQQEPPDTPRVAAKDRPLMVGQSSCPGRTAPIGEFLIPSCIAQSVLKLLYHDFTSRERCS